MEKVAKIKFKDETGKQYGRLTVLERGESNKQGDAQFKCICSCGSILLVKGRNLRSGKTVSCGCARITGVLYYGQGLYEKGKYSTSENGRLTKEFCVWIKMLERCYSEEFLVRSPTYKNCVVSDNFKNFQYFAEWCNAQEHFKEYRWELDKDILGCGYLYSEDTCCFIPKRLNLFISTLEKTSAGMLPVGVIRRGKRFVAISFYQDTKTHLGTFDTAEEAHSVYREIKANQFLEQIEMVKHLINVKIVERLYEKLEKFKIGESL